MKWDKQMCLRVGVTAFLLYLAVSYWPLAANAAGLVFGAAMPLLLGCGIAYLLNIIMTGWEKYVLGRLKFGAVLKRIVSILLAFLSVLLIVFLVVRFVVPELVTCIRLLVREIPGMLEDVFRRLGEDSDLMAWIEKQIAGFDWEENISRIVSVVLSGVTNVMGSFVSVISRTISTTVTISVAVIFSVYLLIGKEKLLRQADLLGHTYIHKKTYDKILYVLGTMNDCFRSYIVGQCTEAVILGVLCMIGMRLFGFPYATSVGSLIGFTALIPVAGAYIGAATGFIMILAVSPLKAVLFIVYIVVLQQLESNLIYPRVVGASIGLPGIWVLATITVFGGIMGIGGMLIGVPLAATAYRLIRDDVSRRNLPE